MKARFPIGLKFSKKAFPKAKVFTDYTILNIYTTRDENNTIIRIEYLVAHDFCGQRVTDLMIDTSIARSLTNEQLAEFN